MATATIYTLTCPLTNRLFYVGCTVQHIAQRVIGRYAAPTAKLLKSKGILPIIEEIDSCDANESNDFEAYWIKQLRALGFELENKYMPITRKPYRKYNRTQREYPNMKTKQDIINAAIAIKPKVTQQLIYAARHRLYLSYGFLERLLNGDFKCFSGGKFYARSAIKFFIDNEGITYKDVIKYKMPEFTDYIAA